MRQISLKTNYLTYRVSTHSQKVCSLYKRILRHTFSKYEDTATYRYWATVIRAHFDENAKEKDMRKAKSMWEIGEREFWLNQFPSPFQYAGSPGGVAYQRGRFIPDHHLDMWHPLEKAQFPEYFTRREQRKEEFLKRWRDQYNHGKEWDKYEPEWKGNWIEPVPSEKYKD